jgi:hypothetical protein
LLYKFAALQEIQQALRAPFLNAAVDLASLVSVSPHLSEFLGVWDAQISARNTPVVVALLTVLTDILNVARRVASTSAAAQAHTGAATQGTAEHESRSAKGSQAEHSKPATSDADHAAGQPQLPEPQAASITAAANELATHIVQSRLRPLYHCLTSNTRNLQHAGLALLTAVAALGPEPASALVNAFDWTLSSLPVLARPPR